MFWPLGQSLDYQLASSPVRSPERRHVAYQGLMVGAVTMGRKMSEGADGAAIDPNGRTGYETRPGAAQEDDDVG